MKPCPLILAVTCCLFFCFYAPVSHAAPPHIIRLGPGSLDLGATLRLRYEYLDEYNIKTYGTGNTDDVLLSRLRLDLRYRLPKGVMFHIQGQDARFWWSDDISKRDFNQSCPYYNEYDLRQAYAQWRTIAGSPLGFKVGRQAVAYGDTRIFGPGNWGNVGKYVWDAAKLLWETEALEVDAIYGKRLLYAWDAFDDAHFDYDVYAVYARLKQIPRHTLDLFHIVKSDDGRTTRGESGVDDLLVQTTGFYGKGAWRALDYRATLAWQFGEYGGDDIRALGASAGFGYTLPHPIKPRLAVCFTYGSGDDDPADGEHGTFDGVFGGVASYYGRMNLFSWMNLVDWQAGLSVRPARGVKIGLDYHRFRLAEKRDAWYFCNGKKIRWDKTGAAGSELGEEIDFICKYRLHRRVEIMAGMGWFFPGGFVENTGSHEDARWFFTQVTLSM